MLGWFQALMPREEKFFDLFARHAQTVVSGAKAMRELLDGGPGVADCCARILAHENEADAVTREVMLAVRRTFITPFDRGDIQDLITSMDDAIDQMQKTAKAITIFEVTSFEPGMRQMGDIIVRASGITVEAVEALRKMRQESGRISSLAEEMTRIEEQSDLLHDHGIRDLYHAHRTQDPMAFIVGAEIYGHLEKVVDRFEDVANRVNGIVIEHL
jgi:predicted phosphate transport protein (TIGR00153 family)